MSSKKVLIIKAQSIGNGKDMTSFQTNSVDGTACPVGRDSLRIIPRNCLIGMASILKEPNRIFCKEKLSFEDVSNVAQTNVWSFRCTHDHGQRCRWIEFVVPSDRESLDFGTNMT